MCLRVISARQPWKFRGSGWKILEKNPLNGKYRTPYLGMNIEKGKWIVADNHTMFTESGESYQSGFHIYEDSTDASAALEHVRMWNSDAVLKYVKFRKVRVLGREAVDGRYWKNTEAKVVVADEMYLPAFWTPRVWETCVITLVFLLLLWRLF